MNILLDTHALLWWAQEPGNLPARAHAAISSPHNSVYTSIVSYWEISIKVGLQKLSLVGDIVSLQTGAEADEIVTAPISIQAVNFLLQLPHHHRDPFDRLIAATALTTGGTLVSADPLFDAYGVTRLWS